LLQYKKITAAFPAHDNEQKKETPCYLGK